MKRRTWPRVLYADTPEFVRNERLESILVRSVQRIGSVGRAATLSPNAELKGQKKGEKRKAHQLTDYVRKREQNVKSSKQKCYGRREEQKKEEKK